MNNEENNLQLNEERLKMVLEGSQQGYWDWNIETGEVQRNERWAQMLGYDSIEEFEANTHTWTDNIHPDDRDAAWTAINDHLEGRSPAYKIEYRMLSKNGEIKWTLDQAKIVKRDSAGRPLRMSGTHTDITERKQTEAKILEQSKLLEMFYKHTHDGIVLLDRDFNFIRVNEAYAKSCNRDVSEFPGRNHFELYPSELKKTFENVVKTKEHYNILARPFEFPDHPEWGVTYWDLTLIPILDNSEEVEFLLFTLKDVTIRKQADQEKQNLQTQLQQAQKMESIGQLTGGMAHDFNNILAAILGYTELAISGLVADSEGKLTRYLHEILHAGERGRDLVSQMLTYARPGPVDLQSVDGVLLITEVTKLLRSTLPSSLSIDVSIADDVSPLYANSVQLHQVLTNLIINAHHAIGERGNISLHLSSPHNFEGNCNSCHMPFSGKFIEISIRDNGHGIPEDQIEKIFEPFFTTKQVGKGSGMGLSMVHGILHSCGGHILVESEQGVGTNFRLLFQPALTEAIDNSVANVVLPISAGEKKKIMIVDDEVGISGFLADLLTNSGYQVLAFNDPLEALKTFKSSPNSIDLVITDQTMPNLSGAELSLEILSLQPNLPIILCTGYSENIDKETAENLGIAVFLKKPVTSNKLLDSIHTLLTN